MPSTYVPRMFFMFSMYFLYIYSTEKKKKSLKKKIYWNMVFFLKSGNRIRIVFSSPHKILE